MNVWLIQWYSPAVKPPLLRTAHNCDTQQSAAQTQTNTYDATVDYTGTPFQGVPEYSPIKKLQGHVSLFDSSEAQHHGAAQRRVHMHRGGAGRWRGEAARRLVRVGVLVGRACERERPCVYKGVGGQGQEEGSPRAAGRVSCGQEWPPPASAPVMEEDLDSNPGPHQLTDSRIET